MSVLNYDNLHSGPSPAGGSGARPLHLKSVHFTFGPPVAAYIQYCIKNVPPLSGFWPLLLVFGPPAAKSWRQACLHLIFDNYFTQMVIYSSIVLLVSDVKKQF